MLTLEYLLAEKGEWLTFNIHMTKQKVLSSIFPSSLFKKIPSESISVSISIIT